MNVLNKISDFAGKTFIIWILLFGVISFTAPQGFLWIKPYVSILLGVVMFGMGMTLSIKDFQEVGRKPKSVLAGVAAHYVIMPGLAYLLVLIFKLPPELAVGVILVGCCPSGSASNVMTFLAKGDTALAVAVASVSTLLAPLLTPAIIYLLASSWIEVDAGKMFADVMLVILIPVILGILVQFFFKKQAEGAAKAMPLVSVVAITAILSTVIAASRDLIVESGWIVLLVVVLHNLAGFGLGFLAARLLGLSFEAQKAITFEVGMQNSGLGASLAISHFSPVAAVPSAIFSFWHNVSGPLLASYWAGRAGDGPAGRGLQQQKKGIKTEEIG
ncbi:bile acid:sodium symporter family protein [Metabacillus sp. KIGAM252]|uniref:Bile acid:sodium symporter family protein n=1 Tax=Metabacillus flavus TaxID=2823519 RepID=A0ABS5LKK8_9BACI|nr:bile acid:sodium symporter family protein [Metabacillus flavus]MBS2970998.1 bile acid:sodium symporter family protein [Metabacillus flavus]